MKLRSLLGPCFITIAVSAAGCGPAETSTTTDGTGGASTDGTGGSATNSGGAGGTTTNSGGSGGTTTGSGGSGGGEMVIGGERPVKMYIPSSYDGTKEAPLIVLLHGYSASGTIQEIYFGFKAIAEERGFIYAVPDGTLDAMDKHFWNATDACCGFGASVDDSAYLSGVVDQIKAAYKVDPKRVYFVGHSNGGFMSYRMACDHADQIAAIVSLAGATWDDDSKCKPSEPVSVAQIHGTLDETIAYDGGTFGPLIYPGAVQTVETWAAHNGCGLQSTEAGKLDLESSIIGEETAVTTYGPGCMPGGSVELWTVVNGKHVPALSANFAPKVFDFLEAHPKP